MTTRMTHPKHGATHAYGPADVERHKSLGWSVEVPAEPAKEKPASDTTAPKKKPK